SWARIAAKVMMGKTLKELGVTAEVIPTGHVAVKESVFPFAKFPGVDVILGPEMRSTGEVMGIDQTFPLAFAKASIAAGTVLPTEGTVFISVRDADKAALLPIARELVALGFNIISSGATYDLLRRGGIEASRINKLAERTHPNIQDYIKE